MTRFDDELWEMVPEDPGPPPAHLVAFVRSLGRVQRALDLGIGDGRLAQVLDAAELVGADSSEVALGRARAQVPEARLVPVTPDEPLPFADGEFDLVVCIETIEHIRDTQLALSEMRRVLRSGGRLAISTPAASRWRLLINGPEDPFSPHLHAFTKRSLKRILRDMGFAVERLTTKRRTLLATAVR
jgi:ubiquinone/menaquinone biosynthesis C-methylase UbiE